MRLFVDIRDKQNTLYLNGRQVSKQLPLVILLNNQMVECCLSADTTHGEIKTLNTKLFKELGHNPILLNKCCETKHGLVEIFLVLDDKETVFLKLDDLDLVVR